MERRQKNADAHSIQEPISIRAKIASFNHALTTEEVAALFALHPDTVYKQARRGSIPHFRVGTAVRFDPKALAEWLETVTIK